MAQFYEECQKKGYTDMTDATQGLRAKVIATDLNLKYKNIVSFYEDAKACYDQVQIKNAEDAKEAARRAVDGTLLVSLSDREKPSSKETVINVYVRPDQSVYSTINDGVKNEGAPVVNVRAGKIISMTYHPSKAVYTGATVGGITTGGVHYTQSSYSEQMRDSDSGSVEISINGNNFTVERIVPTSFIESKFKRSQQFNHYVKNGKIICVKPNFDTSLYLDAALATGDYAMKTNLISMAADKRRLPYNVCANIANLLGQIVNLQFPPSDEELYATAVELSTKTTSAELKRAIEIFDSISDYSDAAQRVKVAECKYEEVLQKEKERAILEKEADQKKKKIRITIISALLIIVSAISAFALSAKGKSDAYNKALQHESIAISDNTYSEKQLKEYEAAISGFLTLGDYKDSKERADALKSTLYNHAFEILNGNGTGWYAELNNDTYSHVYDLLHLADDYKGSAEAGEQLLAELQSVEEIYNSLDKDNALAEARDILNNNQYVKSYPEISAAVTLYNLLDNRQWEYSSGDARLLSMPFVKGNYKKNPELESMWVEYPTLTTTFDSDVTIGSFTLNGKIISNNVEYKQLFLTIHPDGKSTPINMGALLEQLADDFTDKEQATFTRKITDYQTWTLSVQLTPEETLDMKLECSTGDTFHCVYKPA